MRRHKVRNALVVAVVALGLAGSWEVGAAAAATVPVGYPARGIDVSSHDHAQYPPDWAAIRAGGATFTYVKATEGSTYVNPYFAADVQAAKASGLLVGAYAFGRPDRNNPVQQADFFLDKAPFTADGKTLVPFLDIEWPYAAVGLPACWGLTPADMSAWIRAFLQRVQARIGRPPMIYTNANWWDQCTAADPSFSAYPLDIAGYGATPPRLPAGWHTFTLWQYAAGAETVPGAYDSNVSNVALTTLVNPPPPPPPPPAKKTKHKPKPKPKPKPHRTKH